MGWVHNTWNYNLCSRGACCFSLDAAIKNHKFYLVFVQLLVQEHSLDFGLERFQTAVSCYYVFPQWVEDSTSLGTLQEFQVLLASGQALQVLQEL